MITNFETISGKFFILVNDNDIRQKKTKKTKTLNHSNIPSDKLVANPMEIAAIMIYPR